MLLSYRGISVIVYLISFILPVLIPPELWGLQAFLFGFLGFYFDDFRLLIPWVANFIFFLSTITDNKIRRLTLSLITVICVLPFFFLVFNSDGDRTNLQFGEPIYLGPGFILWFSAFVINLIGAIKFMNSGKKNARMKTSGIE